MAMERAREREISKRRIRGLGSLTLAHFGRNSSIIYLIEISQAFTPFPFYVTLTGLWLSSHTWRANGTVTGRPFRCIFVIIGYTYLYVYVYIYVYVYGYVFFVNVYVYVHGYVYVYVYVFVCIYIYMYIQRQQKGNINPQRCLWKLCVAQNT